MKTIFRALPGLLITVLPLAGHTAEEASSSTAAQAGLSFLKAGLAKNAPRWLERTDISLEGMQDNKPTWSLETIQPIFQTPGTLRNTVFFQGRWAHRNSDDTFNLGIGYRRLLTDKTWLLGVNSFYDTTRDNDHQRVGLGLEAIGQYLTFRGNYYEAISGVKTLSTVNGVTTTEKALDGFDYEADIPIPYAPWLRFAATGFHWRAATAGYPDLKGEKFSLRGNITSAISLELGRTDDNYTPGRTFAKIVWNIAGVPTNGAGGTLLGKSAATAAFQARDLSQHTLDKVRRQNDMIVEKKTGGVVIARKD